MLRLHSTARSAVATLFGLALLLGPAALVARADDADVRTILLRQTQELYDAVTAGDSTAWSRYLDPYVLFVDEEGNVSRKAELVSGIQPLPKGITGKLLVQDFQSRQYGDVAVTTQIVDESENYFGQKIHCRYLTSSTWMSETDGWRMISSHTQALRGDPPAVALDAKRLAEYAGRYELTPEIHYTIHVEGDSLVGQREGRRSEPLHAEVADCFFVPGRPRLRKIFQRAKDGTIVGFVERREQWDVLWKRVRPVADSGSR